MVAITRPPVEFIRAASEAAEAKASSSRVLLLDIPERRYLAIEGDSPPGSDRFRAAIASLYRVVYSLHFILSSRDIDAPVGHLHGLFWVGEPGPLPEDLANTERQAGGAEMLWRLLVAAPDEARSSDIDSAIAQRDSAADDASLRPVVVTWEEGPVAQILHVGPYDAEEPTIARLRADGVPASAPLYLWTAVRHFFGVTDRRHPALTLERTGQEPEGHFFVCIVSNAATWTFLGSRPVNPSPEADFDAGLDLFAVRKLTTVHTLSTLRRMLSKGGPPRGRGVLALHDEPCLTIRSQRPIAFQVDGEYVGEVEQMSFRSVPRALRVIAVVTATRRLPLSDME